MESISLAYLVLNPSIEVLCAQIEFLRPISSEFCLAIDSRTDADKIDIISSWKNVKYTIIEWRDDFAWARNQALGLVSGEWVLHLDVDEMPSYGMMQHLQHISEGNASKEELAYLYWRKNWYNGAKPQLYPPDDYHIRMFRNGSGEWYRPVHELVYINGIAEFYTRGTQAVPYVHDSRYIIHSKPGSDISKSSELYERIQKEKTDMMNPIKNKQG